jgi:hypothetical protein
MTEVHRYPLLPIVTRNLIMAPSAPHGPQPSFVDVLPAARKSDPQNFLGLEQPSRRFPGLSRERPPILPLRLPGISAPTVETVEASLDSSMGVSYSLGHDTIG